MKIKMTMMMIVMMIVITGKLEQKLHVEIYMRHSSQKHTKNKTIMENTQNHQYQYQKVKNKK